MLAERFEEFISVDPDVVAVRRAKRTWVGQRSNVPFVVGDKVRPGELGDNPFDFVVCDFNRVTAGRDVLCRMGALSQLLAPGGIALFDVPRRRSLGGALCNPGARRGSVSISWRGTRRGAARPRPDHVGRQDTARGDALLHRPRMLI